MFHWFSHSDAPKDDPLDKSYTKREMLELAIEQDWSFIQKILAVKDDPDAVARVNITFHNELPLSYAVEIAEKVKKKICETDIN